MTYDAAITELLAIDDYDAEFVRPTQETIDTARDLLPPGANVTCTTMGGGGLRVHIHGTAWDQLRLMVEGGQARVYRRRGSDATVHAVDRQSLAELMDR